MDRSWRIAPALLAGTMLASCVDPDSGAGQGPTGGTDNQLPQTDTPGSDPVADDGVDDTAGSETPPPATKSFFIAESIDFSGNGCENDDVNDVTSSLRDKLSSDGWSGVRVTESQTTPTDFIDAAAWAFGEDDMAGDSAAFSVYAGHGFMDTLGWGTSDPTPGIPIAQRCNAFFTTDIRLGSMAGGWAKAVALLTSCTGRLACYESTLATNDMTQVFAFNNSPSIWGNAAKRFYRKSKRMPNRDAWIKAMDNRPGLGKNSPVVYTRGLTRNQALSIHHSARLSDIGDIPSADGTTWYAYTWVDHGLDGSCSPLPGSCIGVDD